MGYAVLIELNHIVLFHLDFHTLADYLAEFSLDVYSDWHCVSLSCVVMDTQWYVHSGLQFVTAEKQRIPVQ